MNSFQLSLNTLTMVLVMPCITSLFLDTITPNQPIKDGDFLLCGGKTFALGFFSPGNSSNRYVGVWYYKDPRKTVVWVANRNTPINDTSGVLEINREGLVIYGKNKKSPLWSANVSVPLGNNSVAAKLLDVGNLVLFADNRSQSVLWQSFDHPTDTMLPFMKLGLNRKTGVDRFLTSWKSANDPGTGNFFYRIDPTGYPQVMSYKGSAPLWRAGSWTGKGWTGVPRMINSSISNTSFVNNQYEITIVYGTTDKSILTRHVIDESGTVIRYNWQEQTQQWLDFWKAPSARCDNYRMCGSNGICNISDDSKFECVCPPGYEPQSPVSWNLRDALGGCVRKQGARACRNGEGFVKVEHIKLPDTSNASVEAGLSLTACKQRCIQDCNCTGYAIADETQGGVGCLIWHGDLVDIRTFNGVGSDLYLRVDAITLAEHSRKLESSIGKAGKLAILLGSIAVISVLVVFIAYRLKKRKKDKERDIKHLLTSNYLEATELDQGTEDPHIPLFDLNTIAVATGNFSDDNKLGEGGFGPVYKGKLSNEREVAVKRLSKCSGQGIEQFKNEVMLIAKLQHRNLVRILGCCFQKEEKILVYEYLPNKSLDFFIFDEARRKMLDWKKRFDIICGVARGMLYLHQESRLRVIHRDLKASNVLLDAAMNPKISDFGLAKIFGGNQIEACTNRVVGTYGYMSPEYAMEGIFSIKSDVYSFGVLLIEIITGRKNTGYHHEKPGSNMVGHVWDLWREGRVFEIVDSSLDGSYAEEASRCIQIGLLCVQERPNDRPVMSAVAFMLGNNLALPSPKQPAFVSKESHSISEGDASGGGGASSINIVTCTDVKAR